MKKFTKYWIFTLIGVLLLSFYPIYMGVSVVSSMITEGTVFKENYPKYIIPYTPIAISVIAAVILMPLLFKLAKKFAVLIASVLSLGVFFAAEFLLESKVIVIAGVNTTLESWQMYMCVSYTAKMWRAVDILIGDYSPTFKLHFYLISVVLIITIINCLYGFAKMLRTGNRSRCKALVVQSVCTTVFLALCILACFTAFFRDGEITVSALSAFLMSLFFVVLGVTAGVYVASFLIGRKRHLSIIIPSAVSSLVALAMYVGEMFLLSGNLYRFGEGFLFDEISGIVLAPIDILVIILSGIISLGICYLINPKKK